jgi:hypothetical protein
MPQGHAFPVAGFDLCISRFGVMFFVDPGGGICESRPGGATGWAPGMDGLAEPET